MVKRIYNRIASVAILVLSLVFVYSCSPVDLDFNPSPSPGRTEENETTRVPVKDFRNVFIMYSMGYNDLSGYLRDDINDLATSPLMKSPRDIIIIMSHLANPQNGWPYVDLNIPVSPTLTCISKDIEGMVYRDTLMVMPNETILADAEVLKETLTYIKENFDAERYGLLLSSHGSGWCPSGYISDPSKYEKQPTDDDDGPMEILAVQQQVTPLYNLARPDDIPTKTMGVHLFTAYDGKEMEIRDIAAAFPFKMDYIIFDACYMGGIEVAYELRNVTDWLITSQTEIIAYGMDYKTICSYLFNPAGPDLTGFCERYYEYYNSMTGYYDKSATISLVRTSELEDLAMTTRDIIERYRTQLENVQNNRSQVQKYFRSNYSSKHQWFYDFGHIIEKCNLSEDDLAAFNDALDDAVVFKAATEEFMKNFRITHHSGLSMYLPYTTGRDYLNNFYKTLEWNKAVGLVQ